MAEGEGRAGGSGISEKKLEVKPGVEEVSGAVGDGTGFGGVDDGNIAIDGLKEGRFVVLNEGGESNGGEARFAMGSLIDLTDELVFVSAANAGAWCNADRHSDVRTRLWDAGERGNLKAFRHCFKIF